MIIVHILVTACIGAVVFSIWDHFRFYGVVQENGWHRMRFHDLFAFGEVDYPTAFMLRVVYLLFFILLFVGFCLPIVWWYFITMLVGGWIMLVIEP